MDVVRSRHEEDTRSSDALVARSHRCGYKKSPAPVYTVTASLYGIASTVRAYPAYASQYDFDKLHAYLKGPAPHPELSSNLAE
ncbi:hypothetical protein XU06_31910 (plasmid) [Rhodococcus erythropolis]|nr:hypothetical protein XU06_31910 [Rhodococcus erythropolis]